jgi:hypothetical protein
MTSPPPTPQQERKWFELSLRHLRMSSRLRRHGFADGSVFHTYHAFECAVGAVIAKKGWPVPPDGATVVYAPRRMSYYSGPGGQLTEQSTHKAKLELFGQIGDTSKPYYSTFAVLKRFLTNRLRNNSLYYDSRNDILPKQQFTNSQALGFYQQVHSWVKEVKEEIQ